jgi:hypothetical protein
MNNEDLIIGSIAPFAEGAKALPLFKDRQIEPLAIIGLEWVKILAQKSSESEPTKNIMQSAQAGFEALNATTALLGVGSVAGAVLSAVNLHQTLKLKQEVKALRQEVKTLRLDVKEGFDNLKQALRDQGEAVLNRIEEVEQKGEYRELSNAYSQYQQALRLMSNSMRMQDPNSRKSELSNVRQTLNEALGIYKNRELLSKIAIPGQLRRFECAWAIDQMIALTYQLQDELDVASQCLSDLREQIRKDCLEVINLTLSRSKKELDFLFPFLFPELLRIHDHDLAVLDFLYNLCNQLDPMRTHSESESKLPDRYNFIVPATLVNSDSSISETTVLTPPEQLFYETLKQKSNTQSLYDQFKLIMDDGLRRRYEEEIRNKAVANGHKALGQSNLKRASNMTIANLYWYFQPRDRAII